MVLDDHSTSRDFVVRSVASCSFRLLRNSWGRLVASLIKYCMVTGDQQCWYEGSIWVLFDFHFSSFVVSLIQLATATKVVASSNNVKSPWSKEEWRGKRCYYSCMLIGTHGLICSWSAVDKWRSKVNGGRKARWNAENYHKWIHMSIHIDHRRGYYWWTRHNIVI